MSLQPVFSRCNAFPDTFAATVTQFLREVGEYAVEHVADHTFADVATDILPQIRSTSWLRERGSVFGDRAIVHREFAEGLVVCYVIDDPWCMTFLCQAHLEQWGITEEDLFHLSTRNLHQRANSDVPLPQPGEEPVLIRSGDGFDATRVLLLDTDRVEGLLVAIPERDVLWVGSQDRTQISELMALNEKQSRASEHPVSPTVYRMEQGHLVPVAETHDS